MNTKILIRPATQDDHKELVKLAAQSKYTKDFSNALMFSSPAAYEKQWIACAEFEGKLIGLACVRHKVRAPETMLYFLIVDKEFRKDGFGRDLLDIIMLNGPHKIMRLNVMKDNEAVGFYKKLGFKIISKDALKGEAYQMEKVWG